MIFRVLIHQNSLCHVGHSTYTEGQRVGGGSEVRASHDRMHANENDISNLQSFLVQRVKFALDKRCLRLSCFQIKLIVPHA
jgi:hypothetical protein